jgi:antitoxin HicB
MTEEKLNYYLSLDYSYIIKKLTSEEGGGFLLTFPDLDGCMTGGNTLEETIRNIDDAKRSYFLAFEDNEAVSLPNSVNKTEEKDYSGRISLRVPKSLHKKITMMADAEGVSDNQYLLYIISQGLEKSIPVRRE